MHNSFVYAIIDGEVESYSEFFWNTTAMNRRDLSRDDPFVRYVWDEKEEVVCVEDAEVELQEFMSMPKDDLVKIFNETSAHALDTKYQRDVETKENLDKVRGLLEIAEGFRKSSPEVLQPAIDWHIRMLQEDIHVNRIDKPKGLTFDDWFAAKVRGLKWSVKHKKEELINRRKRCEETNKFFDEAIKTFGEPPNGIITKDSSEMW